MSDDPNRLADEIAAALGPQYGRAAYSVETWGATNPGYYGPSTPATVATAISIAENGPGDPAAHNPVPPDDSWGLWQINRLAHPQYPAERLTDPAYNAAIAYKLSDGGDRWTDWSTYTSGAYKAHLGRAARENYVVWKLRKGGPAAIQLAGIAQKRPLSMPEVQQLQELQSKAPGVAGNVSATVLMSSKYTPDERVQAVANVFTNSGEAVELPTGVPIVDDAIGAAADAVGGVVDATKEVYNLGRTVLRTITDPNFWKRFGLVAAGGVLVIGAGVMLARSQRPTAPAAPVRG